MEHDRPFSRQSWYWTATARYCKQLHYRLYNRIFNRWAYISKDENYIIAQPFIYAINFYLYIQAILRALLLYLIFGED